MECGNDWRYSQTQRRQLSYFAAWDHQNQVKDDE